MHSVIQKHDNMVKPMRLVELTMGHIHDFSYEFYMNNSTLLCSTGLMTSLT